MRVYIPLIRGITKYAFLSPPEASVTAFDYQRESIEKAPPTFVREASKTRFFDGFRFW